MKSNKILDYSMTSFWIHPRISVVSLLVFVDQLQRCTTLLVLRQVRLVIKRFLAAATLEHRWLSVLRCTVSLEVSFIVCFIAAFAAGVQIVSRVLALMVAQSHSGEVFPATECTREQSLVVVGCEVLVKTAL